MKFNNKVKSFVLGVSSLVLLAACGSTSAGDTTSNSTDSEASNGDSITIEVVAKGFQHQFWKSVNDGADKAAEEFGATINFVGPANETAIQEQVQMLSNAINKNPSAIVLASLDTESQIDLLNQASDSNIPIIGFDSGVPNAPEGSIAANASTDNYVAATIGAEKIFEALEAEISGATKEKPVRIGVLSQEVNSQSITDRTNGFIDKMVELASSVDGLKDSVAVVGHSKFANGVSEGDAAVIIDLQVPAQMTDAAGQTTGQTLLNKNDTIAVFGSNEFAAKGLINANNSVGGILGDKVLAVGFDSGKIQQDAIRNEVFYGSITQDPVSIGYKAVELAIKALNGETVDDVDTGAVWYDSSNIDSDEVSPLLYE
ncbi:MULTISPECIES: ABC transporter substrate-binding protein [unclassified Jeotgalibaca]|uniref:ABC transporter substrate-binding protein n=1 Tax=unclassified Jeotgalibaca TaxID=2621505 RepID=UPI003FD4ECCD